MPPDHVPFIEQIANDVAEYRLALEHQKKIVRELLTRVGDQGVCKGCRAEIYWVTHLNGKHTPYNADGTNHFGSCPDREQFRRR
jgi:hypothetical protein